MPTVISHPAVPLALALGLGSQVVPTRLLFAGAVAAVVPDLDVIGFRLGISYGHPLGHRGFSHSLAFAALLALAAALGTRTLDASSRRVFSFIFISTASHGILDAFTNGGRGIAFLWPWSNARYFAPIQPIEVSPLNISRFFAEGGADVILSELIWVWTPCAVLAGLLFAVRKTAIFAGQA
jgi:inner membrane protein